MKQQKSQIQQEYQIQNQQQPVKQIPKRIDFPPQQYVVNQIYSIRKQSSNMANDYIYKKLTKSFHRIKKLRAQNTSQLVKQYDYENNPIRLTFKRVHDLYNGCTKTNLIVKKKIDKMRAKVDRIKKQVQNSQLFCVSQIDINKIYNNPKIIPATANQNTPQQSNIHKKQIR